MAVPQEPSFSGAVILELLDRLAPEDDEVANAVSAIRHTTVKTAVSFFGTASFLSGLRQSVMSGGRTGAIANKSSHSAAIRPR
jgi:hypothetical protein